MKRFELSQEKLKLCACITMLIDHIGATLVPWPFLRIIGRISFPIYCFLIAEGSHYTRNPKWYAFRLLLGSLLSEYIFDMTFYGKRNWFSNGVMLTLLLGFLALRVMESHWKDSLKLLAMILLSVSADFLFTDYGSDGVLLILLFGITRDIPHKRIVQLLGMLVLFYHMGGATTTIGPWTIYTELLAVFSLIPISLYSGKKTTDSKALQIGFYLFYPLHLWLLYFLKTIL